MKNWIGTILGVWVPILLVAQQPIWYSYNQDYYKIETAFDGIYRIDGEVLANSGLNLDEVNPAHLQLFHRGQEVAIHVQGQEDGRFDAQDYILFYGLRNDATMDSVLYRQIGQLPNPQYNTFTDTTAFFLTVSPGVTGKRMAVRSSPSADLTPTTTATSERIQVFSDQYSLGISYTLGFRLSRYDYGQGWMSGVVSKGATSEVRFADLGSLPGSGEGMVEIGLVGRSADEHSVRILAGKSVSALREVGVANFTHFNSQVFSFPMAMSDFDPSGTVSIGINPNGPGTSDNISIAYLKITYRKNISSGDFDQQLLIFPSGNQKVQVGGIAGNYEALDISSEQNPQRITLNQGAGLLEFQSGVSAGSSRIFIQNQAQVTSVTALKKLRFRNLLAQQANYIMIGHRALEQPTEDFPNPMKAYAEHRASAIGGGYDTLSIRMEDLYDHFGYGEPSSVALFQFLRTYYPIHKPTHLLLMGRDLAIYSTARSNGVNYFYRKNPAVFSFQRLVPVGGFPFSDNSFVEGLDPAFPNSPGMAVGRIVAKNAQELTNYLHKAIEKDQVGLAGSWQKELIHLGGGVSEFELDRYFNFLNGFKDIAEGLYLGGNVTTYRKRSNSVVEVIDITGDLKEGRSLVTFFGHGSPTILDIDIGFASDPTINYQNKGKYPVMLFNGCDYGSAFGTGYTQGEDWVMTPDKGAAAILANSAIGVDVYLRRYSDAFYRTAFSDSSMIYRSLGEIKMKSEQFFIKRYGTSPLNFTHMEQMILMGDPGVRIFPADKADYSLDAQEVSIETFDDEPLTSLSDSLKLTFALRNIGRVDTDSIRFKIDRILPDGSLISYDPILIPYVARLDTVQFSVPNMNLISAGENSFTITVNDNQIVDEMNFSNNQVTVNQFISLSGTLNLFPQEYGIITQKDLDLIVQVPGKNEQERMIILELDTAADYSSAYKKELRIATRGLVDWPVELISGTDSITYYWRSKYQDPRPGESEGWTSSSFSFIDQSSEGWTQRTFRQVSENQLSNLVVDESRKQLKFVDQQLQVEVFTVGAAVDTLSFRNTQFYLNEIPQIIDNVNNANSRLCPDGSLGLVTFQQATLQPYLPIPVPGFDILDGRSCGRTPQLIQSIRNAWITGPGQTMLQDYTNNVPDGDFVVIFSVGNVTFDAWPDRAFESLKQFGASEVTLRALKNGEPYILYGQKGMRPGEALEIVGNPAIEVDPNQQTLSFETDLKGYITDGVILTPRIGPASSWRNFFQKVNDKPWIQEEGNTQFDIFGIKENGEEELLLGEELGGTIDLSFINSEQYPYLRLRYAMNDPVATDPADLDFWQVNYTGVPEGVLLVKSTQESVQVVEGETGILQMQFKNISTHDFTDSIQVDWTIRNLTSRELENFTKKIPAVKAGETLDFDIEFNSMGKVGENEIELMANPRILKEQTYRNNQLDLGVYFIVQGSNSTSLLDVNFDGIYIMDGDIVSPNVMINAILKDDQTLRYKTDTLGLEIYLKQDCEACRFERVNFSDPKVVWSPASQENDFRVSLQPGPLPDGMYTLRVINEDSPDPYEVNFEVINESQITNFYPYPNPFSTRVRFVFTVTGSEVPDEIKIQIMTVTGRVVREILQNELGPIRIGNNLTEYAWDGKDEYGDQLANGVYIYRVLVRKNGQFMEHRATAGDRGFNKGYGKMYLLR
ncbi:C25 family cysteine peptidase [Algoriphagus sp.]|uniref:putative type IX secretion system sortase PorU2 n=1 Tax=Algoriphagus sp. TaxID=1872435 RepID=UPI0026181880|nr:C25 family cysteine peptidase [Algoriphagus sp.]